MSIAAVPLFNQLLQNEFGFFENIRSLSDIMTKDVRTLTLDDTLQDALRLFEKHRIHHAPVVSPEHENEVTGVVSDRDLLRHRPHLLGKAAEGDDEHKALKLTTSQFMTRNPAHVSLEHSPCAALSLMLDQHIDCLLVYDDPRKLQGIVTARDFINVLLLYRRVCAGSSSPERLRIVDLDLDGGLPLDKIFSSGARTVRDIMTKSPDFITAADSVATAMAMMQRQEIRHLPVVDEKRKLIGMLSDREILSWLPVPEGEMVDAHDAATFRGKLFASKNTQTMRHEKVSSVMCRNPSTIAADAALVDAMTAMHEQTINGLPVVDKNQLLVGIITTTDMLRVFRVVLQLGAIRDHD